MPLILPKSFAAGLPNVNGRYTELYTQLLQEVAAIVEHSHRHPITNMANISAHLFQAFADAALPSSSDSEGSKVKRVNWLGFYYVDSTRPTTHLVLGPFNGKPACTQINVTPDEGKGVCAASFKKSEAVIVSDVHHFDGHIACDAASQSEIVVPVIRASDGKTVGVLDVDSPDLDTFDEQDKLFFETVAALVSEASDWSQLNI